MSILRSADANTLKVLRIIWIEPLISRTEISKIAGLDQSTVSRITGALLEHRIIEEFEEGASGPQGGRKPVYLKINPGYGCVIGIELQSENVIVCGIDLAGEILFEATEKLQAEAKPITDVFLDAVALALANTKEKGLRPLGIGAGMPGIINSRQGIIVASNPLELPEPLAFVEAVSAACPVPVRIEHDVRCCCWAELAFHRARCPENFLYVLGEFRRNRRFHPDLVGIALGTGFVFGHRVYSGERFAAGEFKSIFCGSEFKDSIFAIPVEQFRDIEQDEAVRTRFAKELGQNLSFLINSLDIGKVILGGSIEEFGQPLLDTLGEEVRKGWTYPDQNCVEFVFSRLGKFAVAYGAAGMFLEKLFTPAETELSNRDLLAKLGRNRAIPGGGRALNKRG